jgi:lysozyme
VTLPALPPGWIAGVDLGRAQGDVDAEALAAAGVAFAFVRATDGLHDVDPELERTAAALTRVGIPWGPYGVHEPYAPEQAQGQAENFVARVRDLGAALPPALDFELGRGRSAVDLLTSACAWCDVVEEELGRPPIVYCGPAFVLQLEALGGAPALALAARLAQRPLWVAHYTGSLSKPPRVPAPWQDWAVWQVSGDGGVTLPGGRGWVDLDVYRGSVGELAALGARVSEPPATPRTAWD